MLKTQIYNIHIIIIIHICIYIHTQYSYRSSHQRNHWITFCSTWNPSSPENPSLREALPHGSAEARGTRRVDWGRPRCHCWDGWDPERPQIFWGMGSLGDGWHVICLILCVLYIYIYVFNDLWCWFMRSLQLCWKGFSDCWCCSWLLYIYIIDKFGFIGRTLS